MRAATLVVAAALAGWLGSGAVASADAFSDSPILADDAPQTSTDATTDPAGPSATRVLASLAGVGLLIVATGWAWKRLMPTGARSPGAAAVRVAARVNLTPRHQVFVLRVGHRLLVVGDSGHGMNPLAEIKDGDEVADVLAACGAAPATQDPLKADAFAATFAAVSQDRPARIDLEVGDDDDDQNFENVEPLADDVRSLIERVRGLSAAHRDDAAPGGAS